MCVCVCSSISHVVGTHMCLHIHIVGTCLFWVDTMETIAHVYNVNHYISVED